ncbi:MAG: hypothetical protein FJ027_15560 [Candidatus Rokubacteria bacterium]|nr:hypothetical protein [Candidatus Rokubacteria bacterium]
MIGLDLLTTIWRRLTLGDDRPLESLTSGGFVATAVLTSGPEPARDEVVAIAAAVFLGGSQGPALVSLVRPVQADVGAVAAAHGLSAAALTAAPPMTRVLQRLDALCARRVVVAYDLAFQAPALARARGPRINLAPRLSLDVRALARAVGVPTDGLETTAHALDVAVTGAVSVERHARVAGEIALALLPRLRARGARTLRDLLALQQRIAVPA